MENWVILTFLYAICTGLFQCSKKKAVEKNTIYEVLASFTLVAFILVSFISKDVFNIEFKYIVLILVKSLSIVMAWILSLYALSRMSVSLFSVLNLCSIIFSILMSMIFLGEKITISIVLGLIIVLLGLILVNLDSDKGEKKKVSFKLILILILSCFLSSISGIIDKKIMQYITSS